MNNIIIMYFNTKLALVFSSNFVSCSKIPKPNLRKFKRRRNLNNREGDDVADVTDVVSVEGDDVTDDVYTENDETDDVSDREFRQFFESWITPDLSQP